MKEKEQEIFKSKGWQAVNRMGILNENYHTLILNYRDLMNEIVRIQTSKEPMTLLFNNLNLNRFIFNFLASTSALVDSCRNTMKYYENLEIYRKYQISVDNLFAKNKTAAFIKDLRNYQMHFRVEFPCLSDDGSVSYEIYKLKEYNKWTKLSQELINESGLFIELKPLFEQYFKMLEPFYMDIYTNLVKYHQEDFKETLTKAKEIDMFMPPIYYKLVEGMIN